MRKFLAIAFAAALVLAGVRSVNATCADGTGASGVCGATCNPVSGMCSAESGGVAFSGMCVGAAGEDDCTYNRCGSSTRICAGGPFGKIGCAGDSECETGEICVSSAGNPGCGTGFSVCLHSCNDSTTTTTTTSTTTTTAAPTTTTTTT